MWLAKIEIKCLFVQTYNFITFILVEIHVLTHCCTVTW